MSQYQHPEQQGYSGNPQQPLPRDNFPLADFFMHLDLGFTKKECEYACAIRLFKGQTGIPLDDKSIGQIVHVKVWGVLGDLPVGGLVEQLRIAKHPRHRDWYASVASNPQVWMTNAKEAHEEWKTAKEMEPSSSKPK